VPSPGTQPAATLNYAGWWQRVGATIIDGLIAIVFILPGWIVLLAGPSEIKFREDGFDGAGLYEEPTSGTWLIAILLYVVGFIAYIIFYCRRVSRVGSSIGMSATGYRVIDVRTGGEISMGRSVGRFFAKYLSALPCYLGYLWPLWDAEKRTFHDMIVQTRVVRR